MLGGDAARPAGSLPGPRGPIPDAVARHLAVSRERPAESLAFDFEMRDGTGDGLHLVAHRRSTSINVLGRVWYIRDETDSAAQEAEQRQALDELLASHEHQAFPPAGGGDRRPGRRLRRHPRAAGRRGGARSGRSLSGRRPDDRRTGSSAWPPRHADPALQPLVDELGSKYAPDPGGRPSQCRGHAHRTRPGGPRP